MPDVSDLTSDVLDVTNTVSSTAYSVQQAAQAAEAVRQGARFAALHPKRLALLGLGLLAASAVLQLRDHHQG